MSMYFSRNFKFQERLLLWRSRLEGVHAVLQSVDQQRRRRYPLRLHRVVLGRPSKLKLC